MSTNWSKLGGKNDRKANSGPCRVEGPTSIYIDAEIADKCDLLFSGQDTGDAPSKMLGDWGVIARSEQLPNFATAEKLRRLYLGF